MASDFLKIKARTPRYRCRPLYQATRRGEVRSTRMSYPAGAEARYTPGGEVNPADGNNQASWTQVQSSGDSTRQTITAWPYGLPSGIAIGGVNNAAVPLSCPLNAEALESQIYIPSAGGGPPLKSRVGAELAAQIWSVKKWSLTGSLFGFDISETWDAGNWLYVIAGDGIPSRQEYVLAGSGVRRFAPTGFRYFHSSSDPSKSISVSLTFPAAARVLSSEDGLSVVWGTGNEIGSGMSSGRALLAPSLIGLMGANVDDSAGETEANFVHVINPRRQFLQLAPPGPDNRPWDTEPIPLYLCGHQLTGHKSPGGIGSWSGSLRISAAEFWGPGEW